MTFHLIYFWRAFGVGEVSAATLVDRWANVLEINTDPIGRLELQAEVIA